MFRPQRLRKEEKMPFLWAAIMEECLLLLMAFLGENSFKILSFSITGFFIQWAERDINPALFPQELMANISTLLENNEVDNDPKLLLQKAHAATLSTGSATIIVAMLEKNGILRIANVGDCGLKIIRKGKVIFSTTPQEHYFDCPFQLSSEIVGQTYEDAVACACSIS
ncbi:putative protein phosphatase 2C 1 [Nymphaea thermarum]|nr:putative protein phosphatase 2C 1 [Nymphaea thermarum]